MTLKRSPLKREWKGALAKVEAEGVCRACGWPGPALEAAHLIGRKYDVKSCGPRGAKYLYVHPDSIIPLCPACHYGFDQRRLSLLDVVTYEEYSYCSTVIGRGRARRRITGSRED